MGVVSDKFRQWMPGVFTSAAQTDLTLYDRMRGASAEMYGNIGFATPTIVPRLDVADSKGDPAEQFILRNPFVGGPLWYTAWRVGALPIKAFRFGKADADSGRMQRKEAPDHRFAKLIRRPNPDLTKSLLIAGTVFGQFRYGHVAWLKERRALNGPSDPSNPVVAVWPVPGHVLKILRTPTRLIAGYELQQAGLPPVPISANDVVLHRLFPDTDSWSVGWSPAFLLGSVAGWSDEAQGQMTRIFRKALLQRLWIDLKGADLEETTRERFRAEIEVAMARVDGVPIMEGGAELKELTGGPNDTLLQKAMESASEVTRYALGFPEKRDDLALYFSEVIRPICDSMEQEWERSLMTEWPDDEAFPEFQGFEITEGTPQDRAKTHQINILSAQETPNEARSKENRPPLPGGDVLLAPLNVVVLKEMVSAGPAAFKPPAKASKDGQGGSEGRQANGASVTRITPKIKAAMAQLGDDDMPRLRAQGRSNWRTVRERVLASRSEALERRLRGLVQAEERRIREMVSPAGQTPKASEKMTELSLREAAMDQTDAELQVLLGEALTRTAEEATDVADLFMSDPTDIERPRKVPSFAVQTLVKARARGLTSAFRAQRDEALNKLLEFPTKRGFLGGLRQRYEGAANHLVGSIGANECAWIFERAAATAWEAAGYPEVAVVRGLGGNDGCRTGACDAVIGKRYQALSVPTPLHPDCDCIVVPAGLEV